MITSTTSPATEKSLREAREQAADLRNQIVRLCETLLETNRRHKADVTKAEARGQTLQQAINTVHLTGKLERALANAENMLAICDKTRGQLADSLDLTLD